MSISTRIAIGNALVIIIGAIAGTLITRHLATTAADLWLVLLFAAGGITLSLVVNAFVIRSAFRSLENLSHQVGNLGPGNLAGPVVCSDPDPNILNLVTAINFLLAQQEEQNQRLRFLSERVINAQEDERQRIARQLHDDTGQALTTLIVALELLKGCPPDDPQILNEKLGSAHQLAANTLNDLRQTIAGLRPSILDDLGLIPAIRWYCRKNLEGAGVRVQLDLPDDAPGLPPDVVTTLFRITQEAVSNLIRHANATSAQVCLRVHLQRVYLRIEDNGRGFDVAESSRQAILNNHWGLLGIQERAVLIGGEASISSIPGKGTLIEVNVPLSEPERNPDGVHPHPVS